MNEKLAKEWLIASWHNLSAAKLLYEVEHFTDIIAVELHYSCEKSIKTFLAYENKKIPKTHNLIELYKQTMDDIDLTEYLDLLALITKYHIEESYPVFNKTLPARDEVKEVLDFSEMLFTLVCQKLNIEERLVKQ